MNSCRSQDGRCLISEAIVYKIKMSIDKYQQSMENWKKEIILDPHLNSLFDAQTTPQQFTFKIAALPPQQLIHIYMKLTSLRQNITKHIHKDIEVHHLTLQKALEQHQQLKSRHHDLQESPIYEQHKQIQRFNEKYELIASHITQMQNINKILSFSRALEKFKVNTRLLKSLTQGIEQSIVHSELLNTLKISKIIRQIGLLTINFDFSGIKSYQVERISLNNIRGNIFGIIEKELTSTLSTLPQKPQGQHIQKDIINKIHILNNLQKLKDFCIPFYKKSLKDMSELLKNSLTVGQNSDLKDPKAHLETFAQYFQNVLSRKIASNAVIFISLDQLLAKATIKTPFNFLFFQKYWENITGFIKDLIAWSIDNDSKEKGSQNVSDFFDSKASLPKYLVSIVWKYPIMYEGLTALSNQIHLHLLKQATIHNYDFAVLQEQFLRVLIPLASLYYRSISSFYSVWKSRLQQLKQQYIKGNDPSEEFILARMSEVFESRTKGSLDRNLEIMQWLLCQVQTKQIYQAHIESFTPVLEQYFELLRLTFSSYRSSAEKDHFTMFLNRYQSLLIRSKATLRRQKQYQQQPFQSLPSKISSSNCSLAGSQKIIWLVRKFKGYQGQIQRYAAQLE